jgi:hypothetical protein
MRRRIVKDRLSRASARPGRVGTVEFERACVRSTFDGNTHVPVLGCMQDRTEMAAGAVVNAGETWNAGDLP